MAGGSQSWIPGGQLKALEGWNFQIWGPEHRRVLELGRMPLHHYEGLGHLCRCLGECLRDLEFRLRSP